MAVKNAPPTRSCRVADELLGVQKVDKSLRVGDIVSVDVPTDLADNFRSSMMCCCVLVVLSFPVVKEPPPTAT